MTLKELAVVAHKDAEEKGWLEEKRSFGDIIALIHSELSEALEDYRNGHAPHHIYFEKDKPCGIPIELADAVIRIAQYCGSTGIDLNNAVTVKIGYNRTRPHRHGGKKL